MNLSTAPPIPFFILSFRSEDIQLSQPKSADTSVNLGLVRPNVLPRNIRCGEKGTIGSHVEEASFEALAMTHTRSKNWEQKYPQTACEFLREKSKSVM
jgi:hypothetical protein